MIFLTYIDIYLEVNENQDTVPKVLTHLLEQPDTTETEFLKEDIYSSPKFKKDPGKCPLKILIMFNALLFSVSE